MSNGLTQLQTAQLAALVSFSEQEQITALQVLQGLAQGTARQHAAIAEHIQGVDQYYIQIALQLPMLVAIVHDDNLGIHFFYGIATGYSTVLADDNGNAGQCFRHQISFITSFVGSHENLVAIRNNAQLLAPMGAIATVEDNYAIAHGFDNRSHFLRSGGFAGAANGDITNGNYAAIQLLFFQKAGFIHIELAAHAKLVQIAHAAQKGKQQPAHEGSIGAIGNAINVLDNSVTMAQASATLVGKVAGVDGINRIFLGRNSC